MEPPLLALATRFRKARRAVCRALEVDVAATSGPAFRDDEPGSVLVEITQRRTRFVVDDLGAHGHLQDHVRAAAAVLHPARAGLAVLGAPGPFARVLGQG